jgi:hypothetical protein
MFLILKELTTYVFFGHIITCIIFDTKLCA